MNLIEEIKAAYEADRNYFEGEINGQSFKIRMNKDHARNGARNDDQSVHNLSLVNVNCPSAVGVKVIFKKVQMQADNITNWEEALEQINEFFYLIEDNA